MVVGYDAFIPHFKPSTFILKYLGIIIFIGNIAGWKLLKHTKKINAQNVDLATGRREFEDTDSTDDLEKGIWQSVLTKVMGHK